MKNKTFVQDCFYNALVDLMKEKEFDKIKIYEICDKSGFNRSTFYRKYNSKIDILTAKFLIEAQKYQKLVNESTDKSFIYKTTKLFELLRSSEHVFIQMRKAHLDKEMFEVFSEIYPIDSNIVSNPYARIFKISGVYEVIMRWMENGMKESDEEMANNLKEAINNCRVDY